MRHLARAWLGVAGLLCGAVLALGAPAPVAAEYVCGSDAPTKASLVRGQAWSGVVLDIERHDSRTREDSAVIRFLVEQVYLDRPKDTVRRLDAVDLVPGTAITILGTSCWGPRALGMELGGRYLVSTRTVWEPGHVNQPVAVAWRLNGDRARLLVEMYGPQARDELWPGFAQADTLAEALAIVAPNAPATDAPPVIPVPTGGVPWGLALLAGIPGAWLALRRTRRPA